MMVELNPLAWRGLKKSEEDKVRQELRKLEFHLTRHHQHELDQRDRTISDLRRTIGLRDSEIVQKEKAHNREVQQIKQRAENEKQELVAAYTQGMEQMRVDHANELVHLNKRHEQHSKRIETEIEQVNDALLTRDDEIYQGMIFTASGLPQMPDNQIRDSFLHVQQVVEELMRQPWKHDQSVWPHEVLQRSSTRHSETLVKKIIIQDIIWSILFQRVFCSPFRPFGDAGQKLEKEWHESSNEGASNI